MTAVICHLAGPAPVSTGRCKSFFNEKWQLMLNFNRFPRTNACGTLFVKAGNEKSR
jgi:hypothetical protein